MKLPCAGVASGWPRKSHFLAWKKNELKPPECQNKQKTVKLFLRVDNPFAKANCRIFCFRDCYGVAKQFCRLRQKLIKPYSPKELYDVAFAWLVHNLLLWFQSQFPGSLFIFHFFEKRALNFYNLLRVSPFS